MTNLFYHMGFPDSSVSKESTCNAGDPGSIPRLGRSAREGIGYPLQYSWVSIVVKNPPAVRETWVRSLGWEDPLEKGKATHSQYSGLEKSMGSQRIGHNRATFTFTSITENRCKIKRTPPTHTHTHTHTHTLINFRL